MVSSETTQASPTKPDDKPACSCKKVLIFTSIALVFVIIVLFFYQDHQKTSSNVITSLTLQPKESGQLTKTEQSSGLIMQVPPDATQMVGNIELDALRSLLAPHGWGVGQDSLGNLILVPGGATSVAARADVNTSRAETNLQSLRTLLEPHGWQVVADTINGGVLLIPGSSP